MRKKKPAKIKKWKKTIEKEKEEKAMKTGHLKGFQDDCPCFLISIILLLFVTPCFAQPTIDMNAIMMIESSGNPIAHNKKDDSRGLFQITKICLEDFNNFHQKNKYTMDDLWNVEINALIADWYINKRIPQMLRYYKKPVTIENIIIAYNAGISYAVNDKPLPKITKDYLKKYERMAK